MATNTWDKTITVTTINARGNPYTQTLPNPNYIPPKPTFDTSGMTAIYGQTAENARGNTRDDLSKLEGYKKDLGNGFVQYYDTSGKLTRTLDQTPTGGGFFGGLGSFVGGTADTAASGVGDFADKFGTGLKTFADSEALPAALAVVAAAYSGGAFDPSSLASAGSAAGSAAGTAGATTAPVYGGTVTPWTNLSTAGTTAAGTAGASGSGLLGGSSGTAASALTPAQIESAVGTAGYGSSAAADAVVGSGVSGAGANAIGATGGTMTTIKDILNTAKDYAPLIGAVAGAASSGDTKTSTTADKSPWAPAQAWMKANLGLGQQLQAQYAANPFSQFQKQAYNNSAQLGNQFRSNLNGLIPQMNSFRPYQRTPQSQTVAPMQFAPANLGLTTNPFSGV